MLIGTEKFNRIYSNTHMVIDKAHIKPATTWRLDRARQRLRQQKQKEDRVDPLDTSLNPASPTSVSFLDSVHQSAYPNPSSQHVSSNSYSSIDERRPSAHSFTKLIPSQHSSEDKPDRHNLTYTVYSDALDRFSFDTHKHDLPVLSASSSTNNLKTSDLRAEPILPRARENF